MRLATLTIEESRLPLCDRDRAMLVACLGDILAQYQARDETVERVCLHIIEGPVLPLQTSHRKNGGPRHHGDESR